MKSIDIKEAARLVKEGGAMTHGERLRLQQERLRELVAYARANSPYYAALYRDIPEDFSLSDLPPTEKQALIDHYADCVTDPAIHPEDVEAYCGRDAFDSSLFLGKYTVLHTSGTTGSSLFMVRDAHRNAIHAQMMAQRLMNNMDPELMNHARHRFAAIINTSPGVSSYEGYLRRKRSKPGYEENVIALSVLDTVEDMEAKLNEFQPETLTGYASVLLMLAIEKEKGKLNIPAKIIFNSAEALSPENQRRIEKAFGCPVKNNYCMTEGGEIAMTQDGPDLLLNEDWIIVEPVDEKRNPVKDPAEWSGGILVTDLSNFVQPIIRYYVGDSVRIERIPDDQVRMPKFEIRGRVNEVFTLAGRTFTTASIAKLSQQVSGIADFQFIQTGDDALELRAICYPEADAAQVLAGWAKMLADYFSSHGCPEAKCVWSAEPPVKNQRGGKLRRYIDLRKKE